MNKKAKILFKLIVFGIILCFIVIIILIYINNNNNNFQIEDNYEDIIYEPQIDNSVKYVKNRSDYFIVKDIINNYIAANANENTKKIISILSPNFIKEYMITEKNVIDKLNIPQRENMYQNYNLIINDMVYIQLDDNTCIYIVKGKCRIVGKDAIFDVNIMIEIDMANKLYNIYPEQYIKDNKLDKIKIGDEKVTYTKEEITDRQYNKYTYFTVNDSEIVYKYMDDLKELLLYYKDEAYDKLNSEYSKKRFTDKEQFYNYLAENAEKIQLMQLSKYKIERYNEYTDYICADKYNNYYIFRETNSVNGYSVFLDSYTIDFESSVKKYNEANSAEKVGYNIQKCMEAINNKDYTYVYNKLDETFKNNNYKTEGEFKRVIVNNLFNINIIEKANRNNEGNIFIYEILVKNGRNQEEEKKWTIIMQLKDNNDFVMSFSF